ncbi:MAG: hypothetical protein U0Z75_10025 [Deinococcaceae bacterium]
MSDLADLNPILVMLGGIVALALYISSKMEGFEEWLDEHVGLRERLVLAIIAFGTCIVFGSQNPALQIVSGLALLGCIASIVWKPLLLSTAFGVAMTVLYCLFEIL